MRYPYELIAAYNTIADTVASLNDKKECLREAICGMCRCKAPECDDCMNLCNFTPKD